MENSLGFLEKTDQDWDIDTIRGSTTEVDISDKEEQPTRIDEGELGDLEKQAEDQEQDRNEEYNGGQEDGEEEEDGVRPETQEYLR